MVWVFIGALVDGTATELRVEDGVFRQVGPRVDRTGATVVDLQGKPVVPAFLDAHVHLALYPREPALLKAGVVGAIDWGAPLATLSRPDQGLTRKDAGPLLTAPGGYPTTTWGRDGYGLEVTDPDTAVRTVVEAGAAFVKIAMNGPPSLDDDRIRGIVEAAHAAGRKVGAHALTDSEAARARRLGVDVLVHTPVEPLRAETVRAWSNGTVISTLTAFGARPAAVANLRALHEAGATVLYGTDLGNSREAAIQCNELEAMASAGLPTSEILTAGTSATAALMGIEHGIHVGAPASFLVLAGEPSARTLCRPAQVWVRGARAVPDGR